MSTEKNTLEARRWLTTAKDDIDSARILRGSRKYAHSCFHSQQAGEKALKALWHFIDADPWGHSIRKLIDDLAQVNVDVFNKVTHLTRDGTVLDRFYIPTRYPNGLPDLTPDAAYSIEDADLCADCAAKIIDVVESLLHT